MIHWDENGRRVWGIFPANLRHIAQSEGSRRIVATFETDSSKSTIWYMGKIEAREATRYAMEFESKQGLRTRWYWMPDDLEVYLDYWSELFADSFKIGS